METNPTPQQRYQATLDTIRQKFTNSLDTYRRELEGYLFLLNDTERTVEGLEGISMRAHKIRGIAPTLGYHALGEAAGKLETVVGELSNNRSTHPEKTAQEFMRCYQCLVSGLSNSVKA